MLSGTVLIKKTRGSFDYRSDGKFYVAMWHDNSLVTVASSWQTHNPVHKSKRRIEGQRRDISIWNFDGKCYCASCKVTDKRKEDESDGLQDNCHIYPVLAENCSCGQ
ncbi:hypothetical protein T08_12968 [Trichinella sp. T8]|nr:hypothetical protein T08_12968 [Trichinella sp. T8]